MSSKRIISIVAVAVAATAAALFTVATAGAKRATARATIVNVTAGKPIEFRFTLSPKSVKHGAVTFKITNKGILPHDFKVCSSPKGGTADKCTGKGTPQVNPGASKTLVITFKTKGTYEYLCTVSGHAAAGMKGTIKVT